MAPRIIVSYDDTDNDRDALTLGRVLGDGGADVSLAYVTHGPASESDRGHADQLLRRGALSLDRPDATRHVVLNASTPSGLRDLATREHADVVVFGSEYRTAPGSVSPGTSAKRLLDGSSVAVALAPAALHDRPDYRIARIGVLAEAGDEAPGETARSLASALGAEVTEPGSGAVDLLVVGSRYGARQGTVQLSATAEYAIETASSPILAVPRGAALRFGAVVDAAPAQA